MTFKRDFRRITIDCGDRIWRNNMNSLHWRQCKHISTQPLEVHPEMWSCSETAKRLCGFIYAKLLTQTCVCKKKKKKKRLLGLCPDLIVRPAGLPHAQSLGVGELSLEAEQDPAVAEEQLEAVLPQSGQVLVEAGQHETQQLPQVHLESEAERVHAVLTMQTFHRHIFIFFGWNYTSPGCMLLNVHRCFIL